jgi:hypothetical protein
VVVLDPEGCQRTSSSAVLLFSMSSRPPGFKRTIAPAREYPPILLVVSN